MILITTFTLFLSLLGAFIAIGAWRATRLGSVHALSQRFALLSTRLESIELLSEKLTHELRNERAARNMAAGRRARADADRGDDLVPKAPVSDEEKARVRRELGAQLARGAVSALRPGE